ncbi:MULTISPECIES: TlyA family RNA methyltransferase [unclassified Campylobacter]|uniref:23S rRNA (cytidine-2'-O)-methyltransferase TlyA n=1 Tax=unclassified Campylobacter TaxID=2593542 RepID=UPI001237A433|nr:MULTISPECIES: TlyA family RNA methyltransferase [unclassified Campylobacter]KAA6226361.1 TlyA family RNA methyltransferase [Campylobacter sp. LR286c]KAA6226601.1 TlyA family RNA methyltransferase [Campylobacter sp. LR185c]KAA6226853.1 TlyA family RNA methyltransferase [Campylobacter sp. LR196d]KAA6230290.1 TlyA family RNA methyltransferase [Campylobacter sp. LR291e]KAA6233811.1 TlyA family RNA methyltransferase [Campylobacter sp. LR264d]
MRFDTFIALRLNISKNKAKELILVGQISLNNENFKPSFNVKNYLSSLDKKAILNDEEILFSNLLNLSLKDEFYVSRAALKLEAFLKNHFVDIKDKNCLDIGTSTGGFVQILLKNGAKLITAIDVGTNQLHKSLKNNPRIKSLENMDLRDFKSDESFELITCDLSFISLLKVLIYIDNLALKDIILLFKPQFEVGIKAKKSTKGVVLDKDEITRARKNFEKACENLGWVLKKCEESLVKGKNGNVEYFYHYEK